MIATLWVLTNAACEPQHSQTVSPSSATSQRLSSQASASQATSAAKPSQQRRSSIRILTYNVLASPVFTELRNNAVIEILHDADADVLALQEVTPAMAQQIARAPALRGYHYPRAQGRPVAPGGQFILTRLPVVDEAMAVLSGRQRRTLLVMTVSLNGRRLAIGTTHMESFLDDGPVRAVQLKESFRALASADDAVFLGDLNFGDGEEPETASLDPAYVDGWKLLRKSEPGYTWNMADNPLAQIGAFAGEGNRRLDRILMRSPHWRAAKVDIIGNRSAGRASLSARDRAMIQMPERAAEKVPATIEVFPSDHYGLVAEYHWH